ncbi:MAG: N-acetylglucosamine-6-phosphate deacetylase [Rhizobiales bacterium]|nr:N-acetylglucosamine-6-phosphate deacetylase [Hyphomicrobiales bacterium]
MSDPDLHAIAADRVFDGAATHHDAAVVIEGARIAQVLARDELSASIPVHELPPGCWIAPGFIDLQVNGGGDVLFNAEPTPECIAAIVAAHRAFGTTSLLPTLITDADETMAAALKAVQTMLPREPGILGIHLEGPFLSPDKPGVHPRAFIRLPKPHHLRMLTSLHDGVTLVTLAPEQMPPGFIAELTAAGAKVALGHSMATYAQTRAAIAEGLTGFTHLFNAMRPLGSREPGPIAAALERPEAWYGLIVDGEHVDPAMLRLALRGVGHPVLVTDAMPPVGGTGAGFKLFGEDITVRDGRCTTRTGTLAGSTLDMATAVRNSVALLQVPLETALRMASAEPANILGLGGWLGRLAPGYRADIVAFDPSDMTVFATWVAGRR